MEDAAPIQIETKAWVIIVPSPIAPERPEEEAAGDAEQQQDACERDEAQQLDVAHR
jgi:hypothetical protein